MRRIVVLSAVLIAVMSFAALASDRVLHPNPTSFRAAEMRLLLPALDRLADTLADTRLASGRHFPDQWSSQDFAAYTQGILAASGYTSKLVAAEWASGRHVWLLVAVPLPERIAWIPTEATPEDGFAQLVLGRVPMFEDADGRLWFDERYVDPTEAIELPENLAPIPVVTAVPLIGSAGEESTFFGTGSHDPDGEVVLWFWEFPEDNESSGRIAGYTFTLPQHYPVRLTIYDDRGASASATLLYTVNAPRARVSGCPCGG